MKNSKLDLNKITIVQLTDSSKIKGGAVITYTPCSPIPTNSCNTASVLTEDEDPGDI
ncbi:hypothetical protein [Kordia sp.]|uniref:hypothetical protein n=1 Tax=Kordia sp. TaxID=1965332 RepID=UPI003D6B506B